jgi:hypothetical protein
MHDLRIAYVAFALLASRGADARGRGGSHSGARSSHSGASVSVRGDTTKRGTYVQPHVRTAPNKTKNDNWSTRGNVNPRTGKVGTRPRDGER